MKIKIKVKKADKLEKKENRLVSKGYKAVDEGREKKADKLLGKAADIQDRRIKKAQTGAQEFRPGVMGMRGKGGLTDLEY